MNDNTLTTNKAATKICPITIDKKLLDEIDLLAERESRSRSNLVGLLINAGLLEHRKVRKRRDDVKNYLEQERRRKRNA